MFSSLGFWLSSRWKFLALGIVLTIILIGGITLLRNRKEGAISGTSDVLVPTIVNGELVLPKLATSSGLTSNNLSRLGIISANLIGIADQQTQKITAIRILGEMENLGGTIVSSLSPVVRFMDSGGKVVGQKVGRMSTGWNFLGILPKEKGFYDVTVDSPPSADKLEVVLNVAAATSSAEFEVLKIASRSVEVKTATYQGQASDSASEKVEYYSVTGSVINTLSDMVSDITIYSWVRDTEGKVFAFNRQDFKNDLLSPRDKIDFRILLLPLKTGERFDSYEVAAWGKRYRLNL